MKFIPSLPSAHKILLEKIIDKFSEDERICGIGVSGSYTSNSMDKYSDLDIVIVVDPIAYLKVMSERFELIDRVEGKVAAFTGEHVGEPRLVVSLFEPNAIHVDFKFVSLDEAAQRVDDTRVLWERDACLSEVYKQSDYHYPQPDPQWIEDRFWIWVHYAVTKIARGEYFETVEFLSFLRQVVLSPLALKQAGLTPSGVRTIESRLPDFAERLKATVAVADKVPLVHAMDACIELYLYLREKEQVSKNEVAQKVSLEYFSKEVR